MRKSLNINQGWIFRYHDGTETALDLPTVFPQHSQETLFFLYSQL